jgi:hypothetical protein
MKTFGAHYESLFFAISAALAVITVAAFYGPAAIDPPVVLPAAAHYRLTIAAERLPEECLVNGVLHGSRYCALLVDRSASAVTSQRRK